MILRNCMYQWSHCFWANHNKKHLEKNEPVINSDTKQSVRPGDESVLNLSAGFWAMYFSGVFSVLGLWSGTNVLWSIAGFVFFTSQLNLYKKMDSTRQRRFRIGINWLQHPKNYQYYRNKQIKKVPWKGFLLISGKMTCQSFFKQNKPIYFPA